MWRLNIIYHGTSYFTGMIIHVIDVLRNQIIMHYLEKSLLENNVDVDLELIEIYMMGQMIVGIRLLTFKRHIYWKYIIFSLYTHFSELKWLEQTFIGIPIHIFDGIDIY